MLFTDGGYDIAVRESEADQERLGIEKPYAPGVELTTQENVEEAERLGRQELCEPGKLADQIRSDDITLLTVALSGDVARRTQVPLAAATTGIADDYPCGTQPAEGQATRPEGAYLPAEDIDVLVSQFNGVGARLAGGNLVPGDDQVEICGDDACPAGLAHLHARSDPAPRPGPVPGARARHRGPAHRPLRRHGPHLRGRQLGPRRHEDLGSGHRRPRLRHRSGPSGPARFVERRVDRQHRRPQRRPGRRHGDAADLRVQRPRRGLRRDGAPETGRAHGGRRRPAGAEGRRSGRCGRDGVGTGPVP